MSNTKNIIVEYNEKYDTKFGKIVTQLKQSGVNTLLCYDEEIITTCKQLGLHSISNLDQADDLLIDNLDDAKKFGNKSKRLFFNILIKSNDDIKKAVEAAKLGVNVIIVETSDWKIIPIENLIAELADFPTQLFTRLENMSEAKTMFNILEKGVDGLIINLKNSINVEKILNEINDNSNISLSNAEIIDIQNVDSGDRVCIDTVSILNHGEGLLIGSRSNFLFLVHNESLGSSYTSPRPFRVNAGAVHSYVLMPNGTTQYLSEIQSGTELLIVSKDGNTRNSSVGRAKIENRPFLLIKAKIGNEIGTIMIQNAETIGLINDKGQPIPVTDLNKGDSIIVHVAKSTGRHFGMAVDEFMLEK